MKKVGLTDIKQALADSRFRDALPQELREDVAKYLHNPGCACNVPLYRRLLRDYKGHLAAYFPGAELADEAADAATLAENHWLVLNCKCSELEGRLRALPPGRKQLAVCRWEDECTCVVNELDVVH